jgi:hypothetical protein
MQIENISFDGKFSIGESFPTGQQEYTIPGTYTWVAPTDVYSVSVVCVGAGGGAGSYYTGPQWYTGGGGGALAWKNNIGVYPGKPYQVVVGGVGYQQVNAPAGNGGNSSFVGIVSICLAGGGGGGQSDSSSAAGGVGGILFYGDGGGNGGAGGNVGGGTNYSNPWSGGGGAGGYSGNGGRGADGTTVGSAGPMTNNTAGSGGGGAGGFAGSSVDGQPGYPGSTAGGGVGIYGEGTSGITTRGSQGGSGGGNVYVAKFGGGDGGTWNFENAGAYNGAVRIIWGSGRSFPSTNTANV